VKTGVGFNFLQEHVNRNGERGPKSDGSIQTEPVRQGGGEGDLVWEALVKEMTTPKRRYPQRKILSEDPASKKKNPKILAGEGSAGGWGGSRGERTRPQSQSRDKGGRGAKRVVGGLLRMAGESWEGRRGVKGFV